MKVLTDQVMNELRANRNLRLKIAIVFDKTPNTIDNWVKSRSAMLTTFSVVHLISEETGIPVQDVVKELEHEDTLSKE